MRDEADMSDLYRIPFLYLYVTVLSSNCSNPFRSSTIISMTSQTPSVCLDLASLVHSIMPHQVQQMFNTLG